MYLVVDPRNTEKGERKGDGKGEEAIRGRGLSRVGYPGGSVPLGTSESWCSIHPRAVLWAMRRLRC